MELSRLRVFGILRQGFVTLIAVGCAIMLLWLGPRVYSGLDELSTASGNNQEYSVSRLEVELGDFQVAMSNALTGRGDLRQVRSRFDVFFSRVGTISAILSANIDTGHDARIRESLDTLRAFKEATVLLIDAEDQVLLAALPGLIQQTQSAKSSANALSIGLVAIYTELSRADRQRFSELVFMTALTAAGTMAAVGVVVFLLIGQVRVTSDRAAELERARARLEGTIEAALDAIVVTDMLDRVIFWNSAAQSLFGLSGDDLADRPISKLVKIPSRQAGRIEVEGIRADGTTFPAEVSIAETAAAIGTGTVIFIRDIQARIQQQEALIAARDAARETEQARARFFAVMSHEMRTPLNGLIGMLDVVRRDGARDAQQSERLDIAANAAEVLLRHVNDALDTARIEAGHVDLQAETFALDDVVKTVLSLAQPLADKAGIGLTSQVDPVIPPQRADPYRVQQVLTNLVGNAIKFTPSGQVSVHAYPSQSDIVVDVEDTGTGVPEAQRERIFDDFVMLGDTRKSGMSGTGLGLGISRRIARAMGGDLRCLAGANGQGSRFRLTLPNRTVRSADLIETISNAAVEKLHVLVIEDNETNRIVLGEMLESLGHKVHYAHDGVEGVAAAANIHFDMILTDISMPRMDGVEATHRIRASGTPCAKVPIIGVTAHAQPQELARFRNAGMDDTLIKPLRRGQLAALIAQHFGTGNPVEAQPEISLLDLDHVVLSNLMEGLGEDKFQMVLGMFLDEGASLVASLEQDADHRAVHRLAGTAGLFGANAVLDALQHLETALRAADQAAIVHRIDVLRTAWAPLAADLSEFRAEGEIS